MELAIGVDFTSVIFPMMEAKSFYLKRKVGKPFDLPLGKKLDREWALQNLRVRGVPLTSAQYNEAISETWGNLKQFRPYAGSMQALCHLSTHFNGEVNVLTDVQEKQTTRRVAEYLSEHCHSSRFQILNGPKLKVAMSCDVCIDNDLGVLRRLVNGTRLLMHLTPNGQCSTEMAEGVLPIDSFASALRILQEQGYYRKAA